MERISNQIDELIDAAKCEIESFALQPGENIIAYFSEFPSISGFHFKSILIENEVGNIRSAFRQWDTKYDLERWNQGIYNLDRLRIITDEKMLSSTDSEAFKNIFIELGNKKLPQKFQKENAIVLDGSDWKFGISFDNLKVDYQWKSATEDIELFVPVIDLMIKQHATVNQRKE